MFRMNSIFDVLNKILSFYLLYLYDVTK